MKWLVEVKCVCLCIREQNGRVDEFYNLIDMGKIKSASADAVLEMREFLKDANV